MNFPRWKILLVIAICVMAMFIASPNFLEKKQREGIFSFLPSETVNLGLDLQGGSYLLLEVDFNQYLQEQMQTLLDDLRIAMREDKIGYLSLSANKADVTFKLREMNEIDKAKKIISGISRDLDYEISELGEAKVFYRGDYLKQTKRDLIGQSVEIVRRRVDETGTREPIIQRQGDNRILLQVPGLDNPEKLKNLLGQTAKMTFHLMDENNPFPASLVIPPPGEMLLKGDEEGRTQYYLVKKKIELSGDLLVDSRASYDQGRPVVSFRFNNQGGKKFAKTTKENVKKPFAIVLDKKVISAPVIQTPILGGSGIITGNFTVESANDLALLLRAGALPAPITVIEERTVGPSLGHDSIEAGKIASLVGVVFVIVAMLAFYGLFGIFSSVALLINIILILAALSLFQATLTLPGIAGIVLTMGMAVDANVLIFERIKEEARAGRTPISAIEHGFSQAFKTIFDSNVTTLIATLLLFIYGSGPVKGFAVTLSIGILSSMFSAIMLTRLMIVIWTKKVRPKTLPV